jgi:hypothetical protein
MVEHGRYILMLVDNSLLKRNCASKDNMDTWNHGFTLKDCWAISCHALW